MYTFNRPTEAVKAMNAAFSEVRSSDEFCWVTELFWGTLYRVDDDMSAEETAEIIDSLLNVCVDGYSETYDNRVSVSFFDNVHSWAKSFVDDIMIESANDTAENLIEGGLNGDDEAISEICEINKHIIHEAAQYFVTVFADRYGVNYDDFWNKKII